MITYTHKKTGEGAFSLVGNLFCLRNSLPLRNKFQRFLKRIHACLAPRLFVLKAVALEKLPLRHLGRNKQMTAAIVAQMPERVRKTAAFQPVRYLVRRNLGGPHGVRFGGNQKNRTGDFLGMDNSLRVRVQHKGEIKVVHSKLPCENAFEKHISERKPCRNVRRERKLFAVKAPAAPLYKTDAFLLFEALTYGVYRRNRNYRIDKPRQKTPGGERKLRTLRDASQSHLFIAHAVKPLCRRLQKIYRYT